MTGGPNSSQNPYIGPPPFSADNRQFFFGRDEETAVLRGLVLVRRATLLFAQSGAGKSSLLNAGLIPALTGQLEDDPEPIMRVLLPAASVGTAIPADVPPDKVVNAFVLSVLLSLRPADDHRTLMQRTLAEGLADLVKPSDSTQTLTLDYLLIIDQFEELFTHHLDRFRDREGFFVQVSRALRDHPNLRVLFSMREDYIAELTPYAGLLPDQLRSRFRLERLKPAAALDAVRLPAEEAGRKFLEGAAEELVNRLYRAQSAPQGTPAASGSLPSIGDDPGLYVEPVDLQVVCRQLWSRLPPERREISMEDVQTLADVYEARARFYEEAVGEAAKAIGNRELLLRYWFEKQLITRARTRGLAHRDKASASTAGLPNAAVDVLDKLYHVIRPVVRGKDTWYELSHDRLIRPILRANETWWLQQPRLVQAARAWDQGGRANLPPIDRELEVMLIQSDEEKLESFVKDFVIVARAGVTDETQKNRLLKRNLAELGWGIIFSQDADPALQPALVELLAWRKKQAGLCFRIFAGEDGYKPGENASAFLERHEKGAYATSTETMPYYMSVVGPPTSIPFEFQYYLSLNHAVGRIAFETCQEYADYARSVVTTESGQQAVPRRALLFATRHPDDPSTKYTSERLVAPLLHELQLEETGWEVTTLTDARASKQELERLFEEEPAWGLLFVAAHGMQFVKGDSKQRDNAGAVLCQDWPGPVRFRGTGIPPQFFFAASDLDNLSHPHLWGTIAFLFGEFTAGTPRLDSFAARKRALYSPGIPQEPLELASEPFVARLPQRLLSHAAGGALAVVGHVDVNWTTSFSGRAGRGESKVGGFVSLLSRLMTGYPVGAAMEELRSRFLRELAGWTELQMQLNAGQLKKQADLNEYARQETAMVDLRNYIILGDPAVYLVTDQAKAAPAQRAAFEPATGLPELKLHPAAVTSLAWQPDGTHLLTVCADGTARIWPAGAGKPWVLPAGPGDALQAAAWRSDGRRVATLSRKGVLTTWDVSALPGGGVGTSVRVCDQAGLMVWQPNGTALAVVRDCDLLLYDGDTGALLQTLAGHTNSIRSCAWSPDGHRLATTCRDAVLRLWDAQAGALLKAVDGGSDREKLGLVSWSPDGRFLAYSSELQPGFQAIPAQQSLSVMPVIRILDASSFALLHELYGHLSAVRVLGWRPNGDLLGSISGDRTIVWYTLLGKQKFGVERSSLSIIDVAYSPDGRRLWSTGDDQVVRLWNAESGREIRRSKGHGGQVTGVAWHPDSTSITIARSDGVALLIRIDELPEVSR